MSISKRVADKQHSWLSQVEGNGIMLSEPVLAEAAPAGFRTLDRKELAQFYKAREIWKLPEGMTAGDPNNEWIRFILENMLRLRPEYWLTGSAIPPQLIVQLPAQRETLRPSRVLVDAGQPVMLFTQAASQQNLDRTWINKDSCWKASPTTKMERLLRETGVELGLLTNGEQWRLIVASPSETASWLTWTAQTWGDSPITLAAFIDLLGETRFFAGPREQIILALIKQSRERQLEVTDQLGYQVREALRLFVHELDRIDSRMEGVILKGYDEHEVYEACVTFMMRLIFLLYAEENALLPHGNVVYDNAFGIIHLLTELENQYRLAPEHMKSSYEAYARILATFRLVHQGSPDPDINVVAHGGRLFDPDRFPILEGRVRNGSWPSSGASSLPVRDSVMREILRSLKYAEGERHIKQWVSYRTLAVEQIGSMYEGLLDVKLTRTPNNECVFELISNDRDSFTSISKSELNNYEGDALVRLLSQRTGKSESIIRKNFELSDKLTQLPDLGTDDLELIRLAEPIKRFLKPRGIIRSGGLYIIKGEERRSTGTHYTPPELTEPIVRNTLETLVYVGENGKIEQPPIVKSPQEILNLKVCDIAMGSGAFLVQVVRYLSEKLIEAWDRAIVSNPNKILSMPYAEPAKGAPEEHLMPGNNSRNKNRNQYQNQSIEFDPRKESEIWAKRYIVANCVYGVDINPLAVEMAKLSLWLETHSKGKPFTFLDHALKCGDSLVGAEQEQLKTWSLDRKGRPQETLFDPKIIELLKHTIELRERIAIRPVLSDRDARTKAKYLEVISNNLKVLKVAGDFLIASHFGVDKSIKSIRLNKEFQVQYFSLINEWRKSLDGKATNYEFELGKTLVILDRHLKGQLTFHWPIEFPEVFEHSGFHAIVGNPPFLGGKKISGSLGKRYRDWLVNMIAGDKKGVADLVAYFFLQSLQLIRLGGNCGLLATNTIAEADTREVGLEQMIQRGTVIYRAKRSVPWPGQASLEVSVVHFNKGDWIGEKLLDGHNVAQISPLLDDSSILSKPHILISNCGKSFVGSIVLGMGFTLSKKEAIEWTNRDTKNKRVLRPYLIGKDLNRDPEQKASRWIICFWDWPLERREIGSWDIADENDRQRWLSKGIVPLDYPGEVASDYPDLLAIVRAKVKPERDKKARKQYREIWWQFAEKQRALFRAMSGLDRVLAISRVSKYFAPIWVSPRQIISEGAVIFVLSHSSSFALLQSSLHKAWTLKFMGTLETRPRYIPGDCFETFPFPQEDPSLPVQKLEDVGDNYHKHRRHLMLSRKIGLTSAYNLFNNPKCKEKDVVRLRELHVYLDMSVAAVYGWDDLNFGHDFFETPWGLRYTLSEQASREILKRLFDLNQQRYQAKVENDLHDVKTRK